MNIIFDLDGTLIDSRPRLYALYRQLVPTTRLTFEKYWELKRAKFSNSALLRQYEDFSDEEIIFFERTWMSLIETPEHLALDTNFPGLHETLARLTTQATLHVCTARQNRQPVLDQLDKFNLLKYFDGVLVTLQNSSKEELIEAHLPNRGSHDWIIGDTGKDIQVGQRLGMQTCAVLSGFLSRESLLPYGPDRLLAFASEFTLATD